MKLNTWTFVKGFIEAVGGLTQNYTCINNALEHRYRFTVQQDSQMESRRKLLQSRSSTTRPSTSSQDTSATNIWGSYQLNVPEEPGDAHDMAQSIETLLRGVTNDRNYIIGGAVIQTERSTTNHICYRRFAKLDAYCYAIPLHPTDASTRPYGRDPVFLMDSVLYDEDASLRKQRYYDPLGSELSASGMPYGFKPSDVGRKLGTHYVYLDVQFGQATITRLMRYLKEGQFLDGLTRSLTLRFVTYNPQFPSTIFGVNEVHCRWSHVVECDYRVDALPDVGWNDQVVVATVTIISSLLLAYFLTIVRRVIDSGYVSDVVEDAMVAGMMTASLTVSLVVVGYNASDLGSRLRFDVYDAHQFEGANWLLHKRTNMSEETGQRWRLPANETDIHRLANFLESMTTYRYLSSLSAILQTISLMAVILRLLSCASSLPKMSTITRTIRTSISPLLYFVVPFATVLMTFSVVATASFGHRVKSLSSFSKALATTLEFAFFGGGDVTTELMPEGFTLHPIELTAAALFKVSLTCLSLFIFINFVLAILSDSFMQEKERAEAGDLSDIGAIIVKTVASSRQKRRRRSNQVIPSLNLKGKRTTSVEKADRKLPEDTDRQLTTDFKIKPFASEVETLSTKTIYVNDAASTDDSSEESMAIPLKRFEDMDAVKKLEEGDILIMLERVKQSVEDLVNMYKAVNLWALQTKDELLNIQSKQAPSSPLFK